MDRVVLDRLGLSTSLNGARYRIVARELAVDLSYERSPIPRVEQVVIGELSIVQTAAGRPPTQSTTLDQQIDRIIEGLASLENLAIPPVKTANVERISYLPLSADTGIEASQTEISFGEQRVNLVATLNGAKLSIDWHDRHLTGQVHGGNRKSEAVMGLDVSREQETLSLVGFARPDKLAQLVYPRWAETKAWESLGELSGRINLAARISRNDNRVVMDATLHGLDQRWRHATGVGWRLKSELTSGSSV